MNINYYVMGGCGEGWGALVRAAERSETRAKRSPSEASPSEAKPERNKARVKRRETRALARPGEWWGGGGRVSKNNVKSGLHFR